MKQVLTALCCGLLVAFASSSLHTAAGSIHPYVRGAEITPESPTQGAESRSFQLDMAPGWLAKVIFTPPLVDPAGVVISQNGVVYVEHNYLNSGLSVVDPITGQASRILDFAWSGIGFAGGPGDSAFVVVGNQILQVQPDGSHTVWGQFANVHPKVYTADGRLLGLDYGNPTEVLQLLPNGTRQVVASGFQQIADIVVDQDGTIYVSDNETGSIIRVNTDGSQVTLATDIVFHDPMDLGFDPIGNLYLSVAVPPVFRLVNKDTGEMTGLSASLTECALHSADFVFVNGTRVVFVDPTWGMMTWADLNSGDSGILISNEGANTRAAAIGPDDALYVGADGCHGDPAGQIVRIASDGSRSVFVDGLPEKLFDLDFTPTGGAYVVTSIPGVSFPVYYVPPGGGSANLVPDANIGLNYIAALSNGNMLGWIYQSDRLVEFSPSGQVAEHIFQPPETIESFSMSLGTDGLLYGFAQLSEGNQQGPTVFRQLLQIDLGTGQTQVIYENHFAGSLAGGTVSAAPDGTLWLIVFPDSEVYNVLPDGTATLIAEGVPIDAWTVNANTLGEVYVTSSGGVYRFIKASEFVFLPSILKGSNR